MAARKAIAAVLLAQLAPTGGPIRAGGRRLRAPEQAAAPDKPALYLLKGAEEYKYDSEEMRGVPPNRCFYFTAILYTNVGPNETAVPADVIDDLLDFIDSQMAPNVPDQLGNGGRQTLGGLVYDARIEGRMSIAPGDKQGLGSTAIKICVELQQYP